MGPVSTLPASNELLPATTAARNTALASSIATMCAVAVRQSGVPLGIRSQSKKPVVAVRSVESSPKMSASHHACVAECVLIPSTSAVAATSANA